MAHFADRLIDRIKKRRSVLICGMDPQLQYMPSHILRWAAHEFGPGNRAVEEAIVRYYLTIIDVTFMSVLGYKPQIAFFEKFGSHGTRALERLLVYLREMDAIVILDAKREDGGDTSQAYADAYIGMGETLDAHGEIVPIRPPCRVDAITVTPWIDGPNIETFASVARANDSGIFVVDKTSFKPVSRLQDALMQDGRPAWVHLTEQVRALGEGNDMCGESGYSLVGVVMGATFPEEARLMQQLLPNAIKLVPGFGGQGGSADDAVICVNDDGFGVGVNDSRRANFSWHPKFGGNGDGCDFALATFGAVTAGNASLNAAIERKLGGMPW